LILQALILRQIWNCTITEKLKYWEEKIVLIRKKQKYQHLTYNSLVYSLLGPTALWDPFACLITGVHSSLSTAFCHHFFLTSISRKPFSTSSDHLHLDLPILFFLQIYSKISYKLPLQEPFSLQTLSIPNISC